MNARPTHKLLAASFLLGLSAALPAQSPQPAPPAGDEEIQISVYNHAGVPAATLERAEREAARIYVRAGIELNWVNCPLTPGSEAQVPSCFLAPAPERIALRILPGKMPGSAGAGPAVFGLALFPQDGGFGMMAQICANCCARIAKGDPAREAALLGHVMAHELGHLFLGDGLHTAAGMMHIPWSGREQQSMAQGALLFSPEEAAKMRRNASARLAAPAPVEVAAK